MLKKTAISFSICCFCATILFSQVVSDSIPVEKNLISSSQEPDSIAILSEMPDTVLTDTVFKEETDGAINSQMPGEDSTKKNPESFNLKSDKNVSPANIDTSAVLYGWVLDRNYVNPEKFEIDTLLVGFQNYNPVFRKFILPATLGNTGSAYMPLYYFDWDYSEELLFLHSYKELFCTYDNTFYFNTKKPFSHIYYFNGASKSNKEEYIEIFHSQNIKSKFNFGFDLKILSDKGLYKYLTVKNKNFKAFTSYTGRNYTLHSTFNINRYQVEESGGIIDSLFLNEDEQFTKLYDVNFSGDENSPYTADVYNKVRYMDGLLSQKLKLFTIGNKADSAKGYRNMAEPTLSHVFTYRRASKMYEESSDSDPTLPIYKWTYANPVETYDSIAQLRVTNKLQLDFKTKLRGKVTTGLYAAIGHEYYKYTYYSLLDSSIVDASSSAPEIDTADDGSYLYYTNGSDIYKYDIYIDRHGDTLYDINKNISLSNLYIDGGIYGRFWTYFQSNFSARLYLAGYRAGETQIDGNLLSRATLFSKPYIFSINGSLGNLKPSYQLNNYYSNNYIWEDNDFSFINRISLSSKIVSPSNKFELSGNYVLLRNQIYFNEDGPEAYNTAMNLIAFSVARDIVIWKIHFYNRIIYQASENRAVIEVPTILLYNSTYFDHTWNFKLTGGKIRTMLGIDLRYNTPYNGYSYNPSWALFYQGDNEEIGNYPFVDVWFNLRLKRTRFFAKFEHYNSTLWNRKDYFYSVSYPAKESTFKFGISWTFYD